MSDFINDRHGDPLTYTWTCQGTTQTGAAFSWSGGDSTTRVTLTVSDGWASSIGVITVTRPNTPPIARIWFGGEMHGGVWWPLAASDQPYPDERGYNARSDEWFDLNASKSGDADGDPLTYSWRVVKNWDPATAITVSGPLYHFLPGAFNGQMDYLVTLTVSDGKTSTAVTMEFYNY